MDGNFTVISNEDAILFKKLKEMYKEIQKMTINHNHLEGYAVVYPSDLAKAMELVKEDWWNDGF